jgi:hypothetical protein
MEQTGILGVVRLANNVENVARQGLAEAVKVMPQPQDQADDGRRRHDAYIFS